MDTTFEAVCFTGSGRSRPCTVTLETGGLVLRPEGGPAVRWPYPDLHCESGGDESDWVLIAGPAADVDGPRLALHDAEAVAAVAARVLGPSRDVLAGFHALRRRNQRRHQRGLVIGFLTAASLVAAAWLFLTRLAPEIAAAALPLASEAIIGEAAAAHLLAGQETVDAGPAVDAVRAITARLVEAVESNPGYTFTVQVVRSDVVNAAALPGGRIIVFSGLLAEAGSAEEVAAVLAHEICHVLHRDSLRQVIGRLGGVALIGLVLGGGDFGVLAAQAGTLDHLAYGREQERAADRGGVALLTRAGLEPAMLPAFFERLRRREGGGLPEFLSTHPDTAQRITELTRLAAATPVAEPRPLGIDWATVRASLVTD